jgi:hypothetical protein
MMGNSLATAPVVDLILAVVQEEDPNLMRAVVYVNNVQIVASPWIAGDDSSGRDPAAFFANSAATTCYGKLKA